MVKWTWAADRSVTVEDKKYQMLPNVTLSQALDEAEKIEIAAQVHLALQGAYDAFSQGRATNYENARAEIRIVLAEHRAAAKDLNDAGKGFADLFEPQGMLQHFRNKPEAFADIVAGVCGHLNGAKKKPAESVEAAAPLPPSKDPKPPVPSAEGSS